MMYPSTTDRACGMCACHCASILLSLCLVNVACGNESRLDSITDPSKSTMRLGYGIPDCHIGMTTSKLDSNWKRVESYVSDEKTESYFDSADAGLSILEENGLIKAIFIYFRHEKYERFRGLIEGGISATSSIHEVIEALGQPSSIKIRKTSKYADDPRVTHTSLDYFEKGAWFKFRNGKLEHVGIHAQLRDYDPSMATDFGDTAEYRAIVPEADRETK